jgi:hypothetical protein
MEIFGFVISVWAAIIIGLFFIAMIIGCTLDRRSAESPKWWITAVAIIFFTAWQWDNLTWRGLLDATMWKYIGAYLLIGVGYSLIEFLLDVRRSARYWSYEWEEWKKHFKKIDTGTQDFIERYTRFNPRRIIGVEATQDGTGVQPKIDRQQLAESIGCWTIFWPFYAISLIIGDLLDEVFRVIADVIAKVSGRFVRMVFKDVFK